MIDDLRKTMDDLTEVGRLNAAADLARAQRKEARRLRVESWAPHWRVLGRAWIDMGDAPWGAAAIIFLFGVGCGVIITAALLK